MIVVIGAVEAGGADRAGPWLAPSGLAAGIAQAATAEGAAVEVVTRLGEDAAGDQILLAFAAARIGHVATLRDAVHATPIATSVEESIDPDASDDPDGVDAPDEATPTTAADQARPTLEAADVGLALRYLSDYRVLVVVHPAEDGILREAADASAWASAHLVVVTRPDAAAPADIPADAVVVAAPADAAGVAALLGRYAAAVDGGEDPATAFRATLGAAV